MKKYIYLLVIVTLIILLSGCLPKAYNINSSLSLDNVTTFVIKNTPKLCSYRGKAVVDLKGNQNIAFTILLSKKCNNDALINVLGALNNPVASIKYENKEIEVKTQSNENSEDIKQIADNSIFHIISFFQTPQKLPTIDNYTISFSKASYIFTDKSGDKIYADDKFRIKKYETGSIVSDYIWDENENILKAISVSSRQGVVTVKFLNKNGWQSIDE